MTSLSRFPRRKYLRTLLRMRGELRQWLAAYRETEGTTESEWLIERAAGRAAVLDQAIRHLLEAEATIAELPI